MPPEDLVVIEIVESRRAELQRELKCNVAAKVDEFLKEYDLIIIAVKPQNMAELCNELKSYIVESQIVLTIVAGCTIDTVIERLDNHRCVLRAMPNLPAKVGAGMTVFIAGPGVKQEERQQLNDLLRCTGACLEVFEERLLDAATAVTGSGPGFIFYLMEHYLNAAAELGFSENDLTNLVSQTFRGVVELLIAEEKTPRELREMVATKGGTTEAGLRHFREHNLGEVLKDGIKAAYERSCQLAEGVK